MGLSYSKKVPVAEFLVTYCTTCKQVHPNDALFCPRCGNKLVAKKCKVYANVGKNTVSSYSCKMPRGTTINSKNGMTIKLGNGFSYKFSLFK